MYLSLYKKPISTLCWSSERTAAVWCVRADAISAPTPQQLHQFSEVLYKSGSLAHERDETRVWAYLCLRTFKSPGQTPFKQRRKHAVHLICAAAAVHCIATWTMNRRKLWLRVCVCVCAQKSYREKAAGTAGSRAEGQRSNLWSLSVIICGLDLMRASSAPRAHLCVQHHTPVAPTNKANNCFSLGSNKMRRRNAIARTNAALTRTDTFPPRFLLRLFIFWWPFFLYEVVILGKWFIDITSGARALRLRDELWRSPRTKPLSLFYEARCETHNNTQSPAVSPL